MWIFAKFHDGTVFNEGGEAAKTSLPCGLEILSSRWLPDGEGYGLKDGKIVARFIFEDA